jgi:hypothetical protein
VSATGTFAKKNVGDGTTVTLASTYSGADLSNYTITSQASTTADITPRSLTVSGITAGNKVYDGTTAATVDASGATFANLIASDDVSVSATGTFADKTAGIGKTVTLTSTYSGADLSNYTITGQTSTTADITPRALTITADDRQRLMGQPNPPFTASYAGFLTGDTPAVLQGALALSSAAAAPSLPGDYAIVASGLSSSNYHITYVNGTLTVREARPPQPVVDVVSFLQSEPATFSAPELRAARLDVKNGGIRLPAGIAVSGQE